MAALKTVAALEIVTVLETVRRLWQGWRP